MSNILSTKAQDPLSSYQNAHLHSTDIERDGSLDRSTHALLASPTAAGRSSVSSPQGSVNGNLSPSQSRDSRESYDDKEQARLIDRNQSFNTSSHTHNQGLIATIQSYLCCLKIFFTPCRLVADACLLPGKSWADHYYGPLRYLSFSPTWGMGILLVVYLIFLLLFAPFWLLSFWLSSIGSLSVLIALVVYGCRMLARFMSFPGASASLQRDLAADYIQRLVMQLHDFAALSAQFAILVASHDITRKQLGAQFNITGDGGLSTTRGATSITKKASELGRWIDAMRKLQTYIDLAIEEFKLEYSYSKEGTRSAVYQAAYTPPAANTHFSLQTCILRPVLRYIARKDNRNSSSLANLHSKEDVDKAADPLVSMHHVLSSLLVCTTVLVTYINEHADIYSPNEAKMDKKVSKKTTQKAGASSGSTEANANTGAVINSIGLTVRTAEALRASVQYVIEQTSNGAEQAESGSLGRSLLNRLGSNAPSLQGGLQSLARMGEGPAGPARLSSFIMRSQLCGTYNARRFTVVGEDENRIDCVCFPGSKERNKGEEKRRKKAARTAKRLSSGSGSGRGKKPSKTSMAYTEEDEHAGDSEDYDSDETNTTEASYSTASSTATASAPPYPGHGPRAEHGTSSSYGHIGSASSNTGDADVNLSSASTGARLSANPNGTVLYCAPNAGMYETFAMIPETASWLGYYTNILGMDVVFFNYRGYNLSTGVPTPDRVKADGMSVYTYIKHVMNVRHLIVHGESVGGMVATHIAAIDAKIDCTDADMKSSASSTGNSGSGASLDADVGDIEMHLAGWGTTSSTTYGHGHGFAHGQGNIVKALVCDRTFASLDSVAGRLLGSWAAAGLWYLGCWFTNSTADYLAVPGMSLQSNNESASASGVTVAANTVPSNGQVMKILLQDPSDAIVTFCSSMQAGIASVLAARSMDGAKSAEQFHWWPSKMDKTLAAANFVGKAPIITASVIDSGSSMSNPMSPASTSGAEGGPVGPVGRIDFNMNSSTHDMQSTFTACIIHLAHLAQKVRMEADREDLCNAEPYSHSVVPLSSYVPSAKWLQKFCSQSLGIESNDQSSIVPTVPVRGDLTALEKLLAVILRTENCTGHTIGEVMLHHADHAQYHTHTKHEQEHEHEHQHPPPGNNSSYENETTSTCSHVHTPGAIFSPSDCSSSGFYEGLSVWISSAIAFRHCSLHGHGNQTKASPSNYSRTLLQSVQELQDVCNIHGVYLKDSVAMGKGKRERRVGAGGTACNLSEQDIRSIHYLRNALQHIHELGNHNLRGVNKQCTSGYLLPVDCGHSGWPEKKALAAVTACLGRAGFPVPAAEVPSFQFDALFRREGVNGASEMR